jgi:hypothetical protein
MTIQKPRIEELQIELNFWNAYRGVHQSKGIDIAQMLAALAADQEQRLNSPGAREDFAELCKHGCFSVTLAAIVALLRYSPSFERLWNLVVGQPNERDKATRALEDAANTLDNLFGVVIGTERDSLDKELTQAGRLPISRMASELRSYVKLLNFAERLSTDTEARSPVELSKYLLTGYTLRMTGRFHDRCVSGVIGEIVGPPDYNEVAHRMWRSRNYDRLEGHFSDMTKFLVAMSVVIDHTA